MRPAQLPENEAERLAVLRAYGILDTPEEETYDELARIAGAVCGVPVSLITFIEEERQWFKSAVGAGGLREAARSHSFCQYALQQTGVYEVPDAQEHPLFADSPLVTNAPNIRFYAGQPLIAPNGEAIGTFCVLDLQPRKLNEEQTELLRVLARQVMHQLELRRALREVADAHQNSLQLGALKDDFMRIASHDLKNPLMVMMGAASLLNKKIQKGDIVDDLEVRLVPMIHNSTLNMQRILEDFLDFRAVADGQFQLRLRAVDLSALAAAAVEGQREYADGKDITLSLESDDDLPAIKADADRLKQVIANLVGNAIKFSIQNTRVFIRVRAEADQVVFEVQDEGPGLSEADMPKLFTSYAKLANKPTAGESSSGIGLYICKQLIEAHGGRIGARNADPSGAVFWFSLPLAPPL